VIRTLERYVLGELLRTFAIALVALTFVFFLGTTFRLMKDELTYWQILKTLPFALPYTLPHSLPLAFLVSVTLTYGRLVADREVLALESTGVAPRALLPPAIGIGLVLCLASLAIQASYLPYCHRKKMQIQRAVLEELLSLGEGEHWSRAFRNLGFDIYVRRHKGSELEGVVIHRDLGDQPATITAEHGLVTFTNVDTDDERVVLELTNAITTVYTRDKTTQTPRDPWRVRLPSYVQEFAVGQGGRLKTSDFSTAQLRMLEQRETETRHFAGAAGLLGGAVLAMDDVLEGEPVEIASRAAVASAPLVFLALAFPLTLALRSPNRLVPLTAGVAASSAFYFAPYLVGRTLSDRHDGWTGFCFLGDACGLAAAAVLWPVARGGAARGRVAKPLASLVGLVGSAASAAWSGAKNLVAPVAPSSVGVERTPAASTARDPGSLARRALARGAVVGLLLAPLPLVAGSPGLDPLGLATRGVTTLSWPVAVPYYALLLGTAAALAALAEGIIARRGRGPGHTIAAGALALGGVLAAALARVGLAYTAELVVRRSFAGALRATYDILAETHETTRHAGITLGLLGPAFAILAAHRVRGATLPRQVLVGALGSLAVAPIVFESQRVEPAISAYLLFAAALGAALPVAAALAEMLARTAGASRVEAPARGTSSGGGRWIPFKTLDRMLLWRFAWTYAAFATCVIVVFIVTDIFNKFYHFSGENRSIWIVLAEYYAGVLPEIYYMLAPFVTLIAAMWVVFELRRANELTPLMAAGIPPWRVVLPLFGAALFLAAIMFVDREKAIPALSELRRESGKFGKRDHRIPVPIPDGRDGVLAASSYLTKTRELFQPRYVQLDSSGRERLCAFGSLARYVPPAPGRPEGWLFTDGVVVTTESTPDGSNDRLEPIPRGGRVIPMDVRPLDVESAIETIGYLSTEQMESQYARIPAFRHLPVQLARRWSYPASCLVLLLLGLPFMLRGDKSAAALGVIISIAVCALFFIATAFCEDVAAKPWGPPPALGAWLPNILFGVPGTLAFARSAR
jgi:lipopolysaccharide export LptBFGC system permease protein LptF